MPSSTERPSNHLDVILIAPNVSQQMGGEASKALQIYLELERQGVRVHQITHERVRKELTQSFPHMAVSYTKDTLAEKSLYRVKLLEQLLNLVFMLEARKIARRLLDESPNALVHFTSPVSPVLPYPRLPGVKVVIGPVNGNIHYPPAFRRSESQTDKVRRWLHPLAQLLHRISFRGKQNADAVLVSGGERSFESLRMAGCPPARLIASIDSGVMNHLYEQPRITHQGKNLHFVHIGRLVPYKGAHLAIRSLLKTQLPVHLDIIGRGPELWRLQAMVEELNLKDRVTFLDWISDPVTLSNHLRQYRGFVFPSLAEANGIVVQEAMIQGLPVIACNWGGPALLLDAVTGVLIEPKGEEYVIEQLASWIDKLADNGDLAERLSIEARTRAYDNGYLWSGVISNWKKVYAKVTGRESFSEKSNI